MPQKADTRQKNTTCVAKATRNMKGNTTDPITKRTDRKHYPLFQKKNMQLIPPHQHKGEAIEAIESFMKRSHVGKQ